MGKKKMKKKTKKIILNIIIVTLIFFATFFVTISNSRVSQITFLTLALFASAFNLYLISQEDKEKKITKDEALFAIELFNEKTLRLIDAKFIKHIQKNGLKVSIRATNSGGITVIDTLPDQDNIDAFILTIRFFIQDNEPSSLRRIKKIYSQINLSDALINDFNTTRKKLNEEFEKNTSFNLGSKRLTHRDVFDTFIYGGLAHAKKKKKEEFDSWMKEAGVASLISAEFSNFLMYFLNCIADINKINLKAQEEIKNL